MGGTKKFHQEVAARIDDLHSRIRDAIGDRAIDEVVRSVGLPETELRQVIEQGAIPDMYFVAMLEAGLGVELWPSGPTPRGSNVDLSIDQLLNAPKTSRKGPVQ